MDRMKGIIAGFITIICIASLTGTTQGDVIAQSIDPVLFHGHVDLEPFASFSINVSTTMEKKALYGNVTTFENVSLIICPDWWLEKILNGTALVSFFEEDFLDSGPWNYIAGYPDENRTYPVALRNNNNYTVQVELSIIQDLTPPSVSISHRIHTLFPASFEIEIQAYDNSLYDYWIELEENITINYKVRENNLKHSLIVSGNDSDILNVKWGAADRVGNAVQGTYELANDLSWRQAFVIASVIVLLSCVVLIEVRSRYEMLIRKLVSRLVSLVRRIKCF